MSDEEDDYQGVEQHEARMGEGQRARFWPVALEQRIWPKFSQCNPQRESVGTLIGDTELLDMDARRQALQITTNLDEEWLLLKSGRWLFNWVE